MSENVCRSLLGAIAFILAGAGLAACEGDLIRDPSRPRVARNLGTPYGISDTSSEVMRVDSGVVSIVSVDIPNSRKESSTVHWGEPIPSYQGNPPPAQPALVPQTNPAPPPAPPKEEIKIVGQEKPADFYAMSRDNAANVDLWVTCPSGMGSVVLERNGDTWPGLLRVHLRYDADRAFQSLETIGAVELPAAASDAGVGGGGEVPLKSTYDKNTNVAQISIPGFSRAKRIQIRWIDVHR